MLPMYLMFLLTSSISEDASAPFHKNALEISQYFPIEYLYKGDDATTLIRGKKVPFCFWYDDKTWVLDNWHQNLDERINFHSVSGDIDATIIAEMAPTPKKITGSLIWENAEWNFDKVEFILEETRVVNNLDVLCFQWRATLNNKQDQTSRDYAFFEYVYTDDHLTLQIVTSTFWEDFERLETKMENFLNGITSCLH